MLVADSGEALTVEAEASTQARSEATVTTLPLGPTVAPGQDLASVIDGAPGTTVRRLGGLGDFAGVSIRGSSFRQVEVFLDGVPLNPDGSHAVDFSELPVTAFDRVEIYRGYAPASLGSTAMGGVVNLVTPDTVRPALGAAAGSWSTAHVWGTAGGEAAAGRLGEVDTLLVVDHLHTEGDFPYFDDQGTDYNLFDDRTRVRENNATDRSGALARVRLDAPGVDITLLDQLARGFRELPGPIADPASAATYGSWRNLTSLTVAPSLGSVHLAPRLWWTWRQEHLDDPEGEIALGPTETRDTYHTLGVEVPVAAPVLGRHTVGGLVRARRETYRPYRVSTDETDGTRARAAVAGNVAGNAWLWGERLSLHAVAQGLVLDNRMLGEVPFASMPVAPASRDVEAWFLPRGGAVLRPVPELSLRANAGMYARPPDFLELFGDQGSVVGNTDLKSERGLGWEVGAHAETLWSLPVGVALDLAYARTRVHDLIVFEPNSQQTQHAVNVGEAYLRTVEAGLVVCAGTVLDASTSVTSTLGRNLLPDPVYANNALPNVPPWEVSHTTRLHAGRWAELSHTWSYTGATFVDAANHSLRAPRDLHSVALALTPAAGLPSVRAEVLNLFDVRGMAVDRNPLSPDDDTLVVKPLADFAGYPLPGRTVMVAVTWQEAPKD